MRESEQTLEIIEGSQFRKIVETDSLCFKKIKDAKRTVTIEPKMQVIGG